MAESKLFLNAMREPVVTSALEEGTALVGSVDDKPVVVAKKDGKLYGLSAICTHLGCTVAFNKEKSSLDCPCHGSRFALDGSVIQDPAKKPLPSVQVSEVEGKIFVALG